MFIFIFKQSQSHSFMLMLQSIFGSFLGNGMVCDPLLKLWIYIPKHHFSTKKKKR